MAINKTYEELVESAKPKRTTDDCYTVRQIRRKALEEYAKRNNLTHH